MKYYETLYLVNPDLPDEDYRQVVDKFSNLVEKHKGKVIRIDEWGKKSLAYRVKKFDHSYYVLLRYCGEPGIIDEITRDLRLDDRILKFQTVKLSDDADPEELRRQVEEQKAAPREEEATRQEESTRQEEATRQEESTRQEEPEVKEVGNGV